MKFFLHIEGDPYGQKRPRAGQGRVFKPKENARYEAAVKRAVYASGLLEHITPSHYNGPVSVVIHAVFQTPDVSVKRLAALKHVTKTPDIDNIQKAVFDGLNGMAFHDDRQVVHVDAEKVWSHRAYLPVGVHVEIEYLV